MARSLQKTYLLAALLATAMLAFAYKGTSAAAAPLLTGVTDPLTTYTASPLAFQRIKASGARYVRLTIGWGEVAPREEPRGWDPTDPTDPHYWWVDVDRQIDGAVAAGLTPVVAITGAHDWGQGCDGGTYAGAVCNLDASKYASFATAMARRYSGGFAGLPRVRYWQAQNEPNLSYFFTPQFDGAGQPLAAALYRRVLTAFANAVKSVDGSNLVITAGLAPLERPGSTSPLGFARQLLCMTRRRTPQPDGSGCEGGVPFDIFAMHPYTTGGPTHRAPGADDVSLGDLGKLRTLLDAADRADHIRGSFKQTPLWMTEFSWDSRPPDPGGLPARLHARWLAEAQFRAWQAGVQVFFWFGLRDEERQGRPAKQTIESGLYERGAAIEADRAKPALEAFRFPFVALKRKGGFLVWGRTPSSRRGRVEIQVKRRRGWRGIARLRAGRHGIFRGRIRSRYRKDGSVRAVYRKQHSLPFSLRYVEDFYQPPFG